MSLSAAARFRYTLVAGATAVVIGSGFTVAGITKGGHTETAVDQASEQLALPVVPTTSSAPPPSPTHSAAPSSTPKSKAPSPKPSKKKTTAPTKPPAPPSTSGSVSEQVLAHINAARKDEGLAPLTLDAKLSRAAALHTQLMIDGCGLSHQCKGEGGIGDRFSAQGVKWTGAAENIGYGSSDASDAAKIQAANGLTDSMLAEKPPNDGHRKNLLNPGLKRIGLSIVRDSKGVTWMVQDFVN
ncbi:CAP domain-containing protein [Actinoplanes bogorensis]|uniref:CAP domain-containing protein n=1 Tax=Paractinoplanes bogorensis TaxID=1610840 RepID=A0ABS5YTT0_9ACTN|nr:CAP domain-containing protein [Actinoplanes bogorensis]MBU2666866.1 CAP domain-containing protein [Actinoplanes bogorensis]